MSRAWRRELTLRVLRYRFSGVAPFPFLNATDDLKVCSSCGREARRMKKCSGCRWAYYCGNHCQKNDRRHHKRICDPDRCLPRHHQNGIFCGSRAPESHDNGTCVVYDVGKLFNRVDPVDPSQEGWKGVVQTVIEAWSQLCRETRLCSANTQPVDSAGWGALLT